MHAANRGRKHMHLHRSSVFRCTCLVSQRLFVSRSCNKIIQNCCERISFFGDDLNTVVSKWSSQKLEEFFENFITI